MAEGVFHNPVFDPDDPSLGDRDEDNDVRDHSPDATNPFVQGSTSTPGPQGEHIEMVTRHHEQVSCQARPLMKSLNLLGFFIKMTNLRCWPEQKNIHKKRFPKVDFGKLGPIGFS